jgi:hypothetical protein
MAGVDIDGPAGACATTRRTLDKKENENDIDDRKINHNIPRAEEANTVSAATESCEILWAVLSGQLQSELHFYLKL